jgi:hypothetical protein
MKIVCIISVIALIFSCQRKAACSCTGNSTSETFHIEYDDNAPHPIDQCQTIENNSTDNFNCVFRG